jgi:DNA-binding CsgD family transcriptional regulator
MTEWRQYETLVRLLPELYSAQTLEIFPKHVTGLLPRLIGGDSSGYNETNLARRRFEALSHPSAEACGIPDAPETLARLMHQHPMVVHNRNGDQRALKMSDLISQRRFHRLELYDMVYRPTRVEYLMTGGFKLSRAGDIVTVGFGRETRDFSEDERDLLNLFLPHLRQAYANADAMTTFQSQLEGRQQFLEEQLNTAAVVVQDLAIKHASRLAIRWLSSFFRDDPARNDKLPDRLERWVRFCQTSMDGTQSEIKPCSPLTVESEEARLEIRMLKTSRDGEVVLLLKRETTRDCPEMLQRRLGLAPREAEVLFWISKGKTSRETAAILSITRKTVDHHVERIHRKLGTETRTAAAAIAWNAMRDS